MMAYGIQGLAYSVKLDTKRGATMIVPLPIAQGAGDHAVTFIDLHKHASMFDEIEELFPSAYGLDDLSFDVMHTSPLFVHRVGAYIASYVPSISHFAQVAEEFRIPPVVVQALPQYKRYGFAVFQLAPGAVAPHPLGLMFPTQTPDHLFFPTVHVHDGTFYPLADFDLMLYYQHPFVRTALDLEHNEWQVSRQFPLAEYGGLVDRSHVMIRSQLLGRLTNIDTWVPITSCPDRRSSDRLDQDRP